MEHLAEGKIDAGRGDLFALGDLVLPVALRRASHDEEAAVFEHDGDFLAALFVAEVEAAFGTKTHRGDVGVFAEAFFVVMMPGHALAAIKVEIEEAGVVSVARDLFHDSLDGEKGLGPFQRDMIVAGVSVGIIIVAIPRDLPGGHDVFAKHDGFVVPPGNVAEERFQELIGLREVESHTVVNRFTIRREDVEGRGREII